MVREVTKNPMTNLPELQSSLAEMGEPARFTNLGVMGECQTEATPKKKAHGVFKKAWDRLSIRQKILWSDYIKM
jgi:hypothetical protein